MWARRFPVEEGSSCHWRHDLQSPKDWTENRRHDTSGTHTDALNWNAIPSNPRPRPRPRPHAPVAYPGLSFALLRDPASPPSFTTRSPFPSCPCRATPGRGYNLEGERQREKEKERRERDRERRHTRTHAHGDCTPRRSQTRVPRRLSSVRLSVRPSSFPTAKETSIYLSRRSPMDVGPRSSNLIPTPPLDQRLASPRLGDPIPCVCPARPETCMSVQPQLPLPTHLRSPVRQLGRWTPSCRPSVPSQTSATPRAYAFCTSTITAVCSSGA